VSLDPAVVRRRLEQEREQVLQAIENLRHERSLEDEVDERPLDNHLAETASVTIEREIDFTLQENSAHVLAAIDAALERLDAGSYGRCESCGREIEPDRLEAIPYATLCIECKRRDERG